MKIMKKIKLKFNNLKTFNEGLKPENLGGKNDETGHIIGGKWGYIDPKGKWIIKPRFDVALGFNKEGLAWVRVGDKYGYIDKIGKYVVELK